MTAPALKPVVYGERIDQLSRLNSMETNVELVPRELSVIVAWILTSIINHQSTFPSHQMAVRRGLEGASDSRDDGFYFSEGSRHFMGVDLHS